MLSVSHGVLTLATTAGLASQSGNGTGSVSMTGALAVLNAALNGLTYKSSVNFNGADTLTITTNDHGNTGSGGPLSDTDTVTTSVHDATAPNAPVISQVSDNVGSIQGTVASNGRTDDTTPTMRVSLSGTGAAAGDSVQLYNGAGALGSAVVLSSTNITNGFADITPAALAEGSYAFNAKVTDLAGNASSASASYTVTVDTTAPTLSWTYSTSTK